MRWMLLTVVLIVAIVVSYLSFEFQKNSIESWAHKNNYEIEEIDSHITCIGTPFYYVSKGHFIFEVWVKTPNGKEHWWVRNGVFSDDFIKD